jgi:hypothetical protein
MIFKLKRARAFCGATTLIITTTSITTLSINVKYVLLKCHNLAYYADTPSVVKNPFGIILFISDISLVSYND